uniref:Protein p12 n=1 Tax=Lymantria dispar multicapsid nuclear polyhedrosis virus TaxID=10449 RepID=A0A1B1MQX5_NPVLD|nr:protein p12 [Lymantria dispar multiple nucleopolyhedrovirus]
MHNNNGPEQHYNYQDDAYGQNFYYDGGNADGDALIATIENAIAPRRRNGNRRRQRRDARFDAVDQQAVAVATTNPATLVNTLNDNSSSVALYILSDTSEKKQNSFEMLSKVSGVAKTILNDIEQNRQSLHLDVTKGIGTLQMLNNIYDNSVGMV